VTSIIGEFGREAFATPPTRGRLVFMRITPEVLDSEFTLSTAATRLDFLSRRDNGSAELNTVHDQDDDWSSFKETETSLDVYEALELLALGEVISRRAHGNQLLGIRAALRGGAGWEQIAGALGVTPPEAWDAFTAAVSEELDRDEAAAARELAGTRPA
jgi:hypothetical protein